MKTIRYPVIVEGKYDKIKITSLYHATVLETRGFGIFSEKEQLALFARMAQRDKIILLTDSDGAGTLIRAHIASAIPKDRLIQLYTPQVAGKERRKAAPSKAGFLGVEGTDADCLRALLDPFTVEEAGDGDANLRGGITKADFYAQGLSGTKDASARREMLASSLNLPMGMSPNAFLAAFNVLYSREEFFGFCTRLFSAITPHGDAF